MIKHVKIILKKKLTNFMITRLIILKIVLLSTQIKHAGNNWK